LRKARRKRRMVWFNIRRRVPTQSGASAKAFDSLLADARTAGPNTLIDYDLPYPKADFLNALCDHRGLVAHGSRNPGLEVLHPIRETTDAGGFGSRELAFASPDAMWAMWFAILDKSRMGGVTKNACIGVRVLRRRTYKLYYFALPEHVLSDGGPFGPGTVYLLPAEAFPERDISLNLGFARLSIEQWGSSEPVTPVARLSVASSDFPYLSRVQGFPNPGSRST
jgi:hypothetical protein